MTVRIHGRTQVAILCMSIATIIFVLHQMFSNMNRTMTNENAGETQWKLDGQPMSESLIKVDQEYQVQSDGRLINSRNVLQVATQLMEPFLGEKLVHLDLKGAPPLISYLREFFPYLKQMGATGLLVEYEDMFPYSENISANNAYNYSDISIILELAKASDLEVIPLIQTFGHMEFVLKLEKYRQLREVDHYPQVICPSHQETASLLHRMIDQILAVHPKVKYIHIGSDEVYYIGKCDRCIKILNENEWSKDKLFLNHVKNIAEYINKSYPGVRPVVWDDEFRGTREEVIREFGIPDLVDIMIWKYTTDVKMYITDDLLDKYSRLFRSVWIASAFKGATGINQIITDVRYHLKNHISWMEIVSKWKNKIEFKGIAMTGWQRYDHFALLCELLPVAIPSLTISLHYLKGAEGGISQNTMSEILECDFPLFFPPSDLSYFSPTGAKCNFPGSNVYHLVNKVYLITEEVTRFLNEVARGPMSHYHIINKFSSPAQVERFNEKIEHNRMELKYIEEELRKAMSEVYDEHTTAEWLLTYLTPLQLRMDTIYNARDILLDQHTWPRRPLTNEMNLMQQVYHELCNTTNNVECALLSL